MKGYLGIFIARAAIIFCTSVCGICPSFENRGTLLVEKARYYVKDAMTDIEIFYPQLHGFADAEKEKKINQLIENDAKKLIEPLRVEEQQENNSLCVWLDYEIKFLNDNIISVFYKGFEGYMLPGKAPDATAMGTTIDIENECLITLDDYITDFEALNKLLLEDKFESITMWDGVRGGYRISVEYRGNEEKLIAALRDSSDLNNRNIEWYTDGANLVIVSLFGGDYREYSAGMDMLENIVIEHETQPNRIENEVLHQGDASSWCGTYTFEESTPETEETAASFMTYTITVNKEADGGLYANVHIDGQTTEAAFKAKVYGDENEISLAFLEYAPSHVIGLDCEKDSILLRLCKEGDTIYTYWGEIVPMLYENKESGKEYFTAQDFDEE